MAGVNFGFRSVQRMIEICHQTRASYYSFGEQTAYDKHISYNSRNEGRENAYRQRICRFYLQINFNGRCTSNYISLWVVLYTGFLQDNSYPLTFPKIENWVNWREGRKSSMHEFIQLFVITAIEGSLKNHLLLKFASTIYEREYCSNDHWGVVSTQQSIAWVNFPFVNARFHL